jgi:hypothetical protein
MILLYDLSSSLPTDDWFVDAGKVISWLLFAVFAGFDCLIEYGFKIAPSSISKNWCKLTSGPILLIVLVGMADRVEE